MEELNAIYERMRAIFAEEAGFVPNDGCDAMVRLYALASEVQSLLAQADWVLDEVDGAMEYAEQEGVLQTAEGEGLARREKLFSRCPVSVSTALRREAIAALARINADSFTLDAINSTLSGCGIKALAEETEKKGTVKVWFPNTVGVPDEFSQVESIILDIIPCHLLVEFYFRYLTWLECEAQKFTWQSVEDAHHTWESFEKAVPEEE